MKIIITLEEGFNRCSDWGKFCEEKGFSKWSVNEGGGDIEITLTEEEAIKYGIINLCKRCRIRHL